MADILIICTVLMTHDLRANAVMTVIVTVMTMDILAYLNLICHDVPSYFLNTDVTSENSFHYLINSTLEQGPSKFKNIRSRS